MEPDWDKMMLVFRAITEHTFGLRTVQGKEPGLDIDGESFSFMLTHDVVDGGPFPISSNEARFVRNIAVKGEAPILVDFSLEWTGKRPKVTGARLVTNKKPPYYKKKGDFWVQVEP